MRHISAQVVTLSVIMRSVANALTFVASGDSERTALWCSCVMLGDHSSNLRRVAKPEILKVGCLRDDLK